MQTFIQQSELYREMKEFECGNFVVDKKTIGMTEEIEHGIENIMHETRNSLIDDISLLLYTHKWRMMNAYDIIRERVKDKIFQNKYNTEILRNEVCNDIWREMFNTKKDMAEIAAFGMLWLMKIVHKNGCPWDRETCEFAATNGHLDCLKYAHENGCLWNKETCENAAMNGHLCCLKYAHFNDCPWDDETCAFAAMNGHLNCLKYAHENGCPWDRFTCEFALVSDHHECFAYAINNGCWYAVDEGDEYIEERNDENDGENEEERIQRVEMSFFD